MMEIRKLSKLGKNVGLSKNQFYKYFCFEKRLFLTSKSLHRFCYHSSTISREVSKKDVSGKLPQVYEPSLVEAGWYEWWEGKGFFKLPIGSKCIKENRPFTMILPPPNITGTLHLGHALTVTIQDVIARWQRMSGKEVLWIPGTDHAGIATQVVVEKKLWAEEKVTRHDLGREKFLNKIRDWQREKGSQIQDQLCLMGASLDWNREYFTMDENQTYAVLEAFIQLFEEGLIYRSNVPVSWSCWLQSTISDIEIENHEINGPTHLEVPGYEKPITFGTLTNIMYCGVDNDNKIIVSTTRPETMLGDVAIAVHPDDPRYSHLHNSYFWHPYRHEKIPLIFDDFVDRNFGSGAVKITPAHDKVDFEVSKRHNLMVVPVIDKCGMICDNFDKFKGMKRFNAREVIVQDLTSQGLIQGEEPHKMIIPVCGRSGDIVELIPISQWFLSTKDMAQKAIRAVKENHLRFIPKEAEENWFQWFEKNQDWCLSRQLWWGHRIPVYKCSLSNETSSKWFAAKSAEDAKSKASVFYSCHPNDSRLVAEQDEDVLDTWFSSSLLPFSALGWPKETEDFKYLYPLSLMETGNDILLFWVARMVMLGEHLTNQLPFKDAILHGVIRDSSGRKMSKSIGNVVAPEDIREGRSIEELEERVVSSNKLGIIPTQELKNAVRNQHKMFPNGIPECGTDALRFSLCSLPINSHFIDFDVNDCYSFRRFCNKIWQACRYIEGEMEHYDSKFTEKLIEQQDFNVMDRWILSKLSTLISSLDEGMNRSSLNQCVQSLRNFVHHEFCDVYLESTKSVLRSSNIEAAQTSKKILATCMENVIVLLAPFMPFLCEELYQRVTFIPKKYDSVTLCTYPKPKEWLCWQNFGIEKDIDLILQTVTTIRKLKGNNGFKQKDKASVILLSESENELKTFQTHEHLLETLSSSKIKDYFKQNSSCDSFTRERLNDTCVISIMLEDDNQRQLSVTHRKGLVSSALQKHIKLEKEITKTKNILKSPKFWTNAPKDVQQNLPKKLTIMEEEFSKLDIFLSQEPALRESLKKILLDRKVSKLKKGVK